MSKKIISAVLICCFLVSGILSGVSVHAADVPAWNFNANGELTINDASAVGDYTSAQDVPWNLFASLVTTVTVDPAISYIGAYSLNNLNAAVHIDNGNTTISEHAFDNAGEDFVIISVYNSPVYTYAREHGLAFEGISIASGQCGETVRWNIYPDGTLHIRGTGAMTDYYKDPTSTPWYSYSSMITNVLVEEGITFVSSYTVFSANACMSATILGADTQVSVSAFQTMNSNFTIYGHLDSSAQEVAQAKGYQFVPFTIDSGSCGTNVTWTLYTNGLLKIDGTGSMEYYRDPTKLPYFSYGNKITAIEIGTGVAKLADYVYYPGYLNCVSFTVLNPATTFQTTTISSGSSKLVVYGYFGSAAQTYAEQKSLQFAPCNPILTGGTCGTNTSWSLDESGVLSIYGTGDMTDFGPIGQTPWISYNSFVTCVEIGAGVTSITEFTYYGMINCTSFVVLNPNATFHMYTIAAKNDKLVIYGYKGSTAQAYAQSNKITFVALD